MRDIIWIIWILNRFWNKIVFFQLDWSDGVTLTSMHSDFGRVNILLKKFHNKVKVLKNIFQLVSFKDHPVFSKTKKKARPLMPKEILHFYYVYCIKNSFCICIRVLYWQDEKKRCLKMTSIGWAVSILSRFSINWIRKSFILYLEKGQSLRKLAVSYTCVDLERFWT